MPMNKIQLTLSQLRDIRYGPYRQFPTIPINWLEITYRYLKANCGVKHIDNVGMYRYILKFDSESDLVEFSLRHL
jgi:hypothetical protein